MLYHLPLDIYSMIVQCLLPDEFQQLYIACNDNIIQKYLKQHCVIICKTIITDELVEWLERNGIKVQLLRECVKTPFEKKYFTNGNYHSINDEPAYFIQKNNYWCKMWYKHGILHRDNGPCYIHKTETDLCRIEYWKNGQHIITEYLE